MRWQHTRTASIFVLVIFAVLVKWYFAFRTFPDPFDDPNFMNKLAFTMVSVLGGVVAHTIHYQEEQLKQNDFQ